MRYCSCFEAVSRGGLPCQKLRLKGLPCIIETRRSPALLLVADAVGVRRQTSYWYVDVAVVMPCRVMSCRLVSSTSRNAGAQGELTFSRIGMHRLETGSSIGNFVCALVVRASVGPLFGQILLQKKRLLTGRVVAAVKVRVPPLLFR